jgi:hypothetical protein
VPQFYTQFTAVNEGYILNAEIAEIAEDSTKFILCALGALCV